MVEESPTCNDKLATSLYLALLQQSVFSCYAYGRPRNHRQQIWKSAGIIQNMFSIAS